jgi:hypothetical protein
MKKSTIKAKIRNTTEWKNLRVKIFERQQGVCPFCGSKLFKGFNIHHKDNRIENYDNFNNLDSFTALHRDCHKMIESLHRKKYLPLELKLIIDKFFSTY